MSYNPSDQENQGRQPLISPTGKDKEPLENPKAKSPTLFETVKKKVSSALTSTGINDYGSIPLTAENLSSKNIRDRDVIQRQGQPPLSGGNSQLGKLLDLKTNISIDDFAETNSLAEFNKPVPLQNKMIRSGRQRKKTAARTKGGEFQAKRKKRRIYFCSIGSEIDVEGLADRFSSESHLGLRGKMYAEVLHLYVENNRLQEPLKEATAAAALLNSNYPPGEMSPKETYGLPLDEGHQSQRDHKNSYSRSSDREDLLHFDESDHLYPEKHLSPQPPEPQPQQHSLFTIDENPRIEEEVEESLHIPSSAITPMPLRLGKTQRSASDPGIAYHHLSASVPTEEKGVSYDLEEEAIGLPLHLSISPPLPAAKEEAEETLLPGLPIANHRPSITTYHATDIAEDEIVANFDYWQNGGREIFVFDFGAIVFWGYHRDEVSDLLSFFQSFVVKGRLSEEEFKAGEDDMAFVLSLEATSITIANDVITLPEITSVKSRLAVSFAIAQSTILSVFEARIEEKIEDYKYIPEVLARSGHLPLSAKELGNMIGEVFVIRHDVNLHNEILNIPDYFWKEYSVEPIYRMTSMYLEMEPRTEVLNKRLDLMRELLKLLQHQHENSHAIKLEWIVIWLIVISVVLELFVIVGKLLNLWE